MSTVDAPDISLAKPVMPTGMETPPPTTSWFDPRPVIVISGGLILLSLAISAYFITRSYPLDPWESAIVTDGWRVVHHQPVYTDPVTGHATHMYGPLTTYLAASIVALTGPTFYGVRAVSLAASWFLIALTVSWFRDRINTRGGLLMFVGFLNVANLFAQFYFTASRPDMITLAMMGVAVTCFYRGYARDSIVTFLIGALFLVLAFGFKQPAAAVAAVLPFSILLDRRRPLVKWLALSLVPGVAIVLIVIIEMKFAPWVFYYTFAVVRRWPVPWRTVVEWSTRVPLQVPVVLLAAYVWFDRRRDGEPVDPRMKWLIAAAVVLAPACILALSKGGGANNSLLPILWVLLTFAAVALQPARDVNNTSDRRQPFYRGCVIGIALLLTAFPQSLWQVQYFRWKHGDGNYERVIAVASKLPGKVVSPDDPTIALRAKGYAGRCGQVERDAQGPPIDQPALLTPREAQGADWYLGVKWSYNPSVSSDQLTQMGFVEVPLLPDAPATVYHLWKKQSGRPATTATTATALSN